MTRRVLFIAVVIGFALLTASTIAVLSGCGVAVLLGYGDDDILGNSKDAKKCRSLADEYWDVETYLAWRRTSRAIRNNSFTHALPCSAYVEVYLETGKFGECSSGQQRLYYETIGKYDQFIAGWNDLKDERTGNAIVAYTQVDSVENVDSSIRLEYEKCRDDL